MALVAAIILFPGALTPGLRETVMRRSTFGYREARWMDRIAPPGATIMSDNRAYALYPRPFIVPACDSCFRDALVFAEYPMEGKLPEGCHSTLIAGPETFPYATRTPVFTSSSYQAVALKVNCH